MDANNSNELCFVNSIAQSKCEHCQSNYVLKLRVHDLLKNKHYIRPLLRNDAFFIVFDGELDLTINGMPFSMKKNEIVVLPVFSSITILPKEDSRIYIQSFISGKRHVCFGRKISSKGLQYSSLSQFKPYKLIISEDLRLFVQVAIKQLEKFPDCNLMYLSKMHELGMYLASDYSTTDLLRFIQPILREDYQFLNTLNTGLENYRKVSDMVEWMDMDEVAFRKKFECLVGQDPQEWLDVIRKNLVLRYIVSYTCSVMGVMSKFGFSSRDHLNYYSLANYKKPIEELINFYSNYPFKK